MTSNSDSVRPMLGGRMRRCTSFSAMCARSIARNTDGMRMKDVASKTLTSPANTTRIVSDLEDRGLVVRHRSKQSDREVLATLTAKGNALFQKTFLEVARFTAETIDSALSERDQTRVATHLEALVKLMKPGRPPLG